MAKMKARGSFRYAGKRLAAGEEFDTRTDRDATLLEAAGRALPVQKAELREATIARRRGGRPKEAIASVAAAPAVAPVVSDVEATHDTVEPGRTYERRDLEAKEGE